MAALHRLLTIVCLAAACSAHAQQDDAAALELADRPAAAPQAAGKHRVYVEGAAARNWLRGGAPNDDTARASLDPRLDATLASGLRGV